MKRFIVRNYGPTRQFPYKDMQIFIANDCVRETDDVEMAMALKKEKQVTVTDRGSEVTSLSPSVEEPETSEVSEESQEISYGEMKVKDLQILAKDREIKTSGLNKAELIQALEDYDAAPAEEVAEEVAV